jgi:hypothetical protein
MSPEQAQGLKLDSRSDIFSFGALLYEMITGQPAFSGETKLSTLASVINQEPKPATQIVDGLPREVERIIGLCLRQNPTRRLQHMEDIKVALEELKEDSDSGRLASSMSSPVPVVAQRGISRRASFLRAGILLSLPVAVIALVWGYLHRASNTTRQGAGDRPGGRLTMLVTAEKMAFDPALSPDGKMIASVADDGGQRDLFVSRVAGGDRVRLTNTEAREVGPRFSPDGEHIVFTRGGGDAASPEIWGVPTLGGQSVRLLADAMDGAWSPDGARLVFVSRKPGVADNLATAAADGTDVRTIMRSDGDYPFFRSPAWSPDGTQVVVVRSAGGIAGRAPQHTRRPATRSGGGAERRRHCRGTLAGTGERRRGAAAVERSAGDL